MHEWDKPEYQEMIEHLKKASPQKSRKYSGYGLDLSDIDLNYLYENVFNRIAALESLIAVARAASLMWDAEVRLSETEYKRGSVGHDFIGGQVLLWKTELHEALDAVPGWVLEEEE